MGLNSISNFPSAPADGAGIPPYLLVSFDGRDSSEKGGLNPPRLNLDKGLKAVIIEDELGAAWLLQALLEALGHQVLVIYTTAEEALAAGLGDANLALIDINLGSGMDGIAAAQQLSSMSSARIIFCSAYSDEATRQRVLTDVPHARLIGKPVSEHELSTAISAAMLSPGS